MTTKAGCKKYSQHIKVHKLLKSYLVAIHSNFTEKLGWNIKFYSHTKLLAGVISNQRHIKKVNVAV